MLFSEWVQGKDRVMVVVRGVPGSGKSYTARELLKKYGGGDPHDHIFSTDDYWNYDVKQERRNKVAANEPVDHQYYDDLEKETYRANWNPEKLAGAHNWNFHRFKQAVEKWITPIIVDNTNIKARDARGYVELAEKAGYKIVIAESESPWWKDIQPLLKDKQKNGTALEDYARFLAGHHQGLSAKYGTNGNTHGVPLDTIRGMIRKWQPSVTTDDIMGRSERAKKGSW